MEGRSGAPPGREHLGEGEGGLLGWQQQGVHSCRDETLISGGRGGLKEEVKVSSNEVAVGSRDLLETEMKQLVRHLRSAMSAGEAAMLRLDQVYFSLLVLSVRIITCCGHS